MESSRTDQLIACIRRELEEQRPSLDANAPLTSVSVFVQLHPDGNVRRVQFRADRQRELDRDRRVLLSESQKDTR